MINTSAKIEFAIAAAAVVMAIGVAVAFDDPGGFVLLFGVCMALALAGLAVAASGFSDRAPRYPSPADAPPVQMVTVGRTQTPRPSPWPLFGAIAAAVVAIGLAAGHGLVIVGVICALLASAGWLSQTWREDPSFSPREGARISSRLLTPVGLPVMALGLIAVVVISVSRILLTLPRAGSISVAFVLAVLLLVAFFALSSRPNLGRRTLAFFAGFAILAVVTAGSVSAANGYRTFDKQSIGPAPLTLVAHHTAYQQKTLTVVQGQSTTIKFENLDSGIYHNVAVYGKDGTPYWAGEPVKGVRNISLTHTFDLPPGTYTFRCDFHPTIMVGTFIVEPSTASTLTTTPTP